MIPKKIMTIIMTWIVLAIPIGLASAGNPIARASPPDAADEVDEAPADPDAYNPGEVGTFVDEDASDPRTPDPQIEDVTLIGTAVVEGGSSFAVLQLSDQTRLVREGDEIVGGVRLVKVGRNRIDVESDGVQQEILLGSNEGRRQQVRPGSIRGAVTEADVQGLREYRTQKFHDLLEWVARHRG